MTAHWHRGVLDEAALRPLDELFSAGRPGQRLPLSCELIAALTPVTAIIGVGRPVRAVTFNKSATANWGVPWHQDRVITVADRHDLPGYTNWSQKQGKWHCEPPVEILDAMRFVRVHLDEAGEAEGAMEIAVGSHEAGIVAAESAEAAARKYPQEVCTARRGDILSLPMLTLHRSLPGAAPKARRVLRLDYAAFDLPAPLAWAG